MTSLAPARAAPISREYTVPLYSQADVARITAMHPSTVHDWASGYTTTSGVRQAPVLTGVKPGRGITVPFLGLAEAYVLGAFRRAGLPMQRIRPAVKVLREELGLDYALASKRLATDGADVLYRAGDSEDQRLIVVRNHQAVFGEVVADYLEFIEWGDSGLASVIRLPQYEDAEITVTPTINGGQPTVTRRGVSITAILGRVRAGDAPREVADDFGLTLDEVLYLNRAVAA